MKAPAATDAKYGFGRLIDLARAEPSSASNHSRSVKSITTSASSPTSRSPLSAAAGYHPATAPIVAYSAILAKTGQEQHGGSE